jgi:hypothetical protein
MAAAVRVKGELQAGGVDARMAGAYGHFSTYDEVPVPPGPHGSVNQVRNSFDVTASSALYGSAIFSQPTLRGSHSGRLELRADGAFRARLCHQAAGPRAEERSINLDAVGRWSYLEGSSRLVLAPNDKSMRVEVTALGPVFAAGGTGTLAEEEQRQTRASASLQSSPSSVASSNQEDADDAARRVLASDAAVGLLVTIHQGSRGERGGGERVWKTLSYPCLRAE